MNKIEKLTPAQESDMLAFREECLRIGRSTEPADRAAAEKSITQMYAWVGKPAPRFWWCDGPAVGSLVRAILSDKTKAANLWANLGDNLLDNLGAGLNWYFWGQHELAWPAFYSWCGGLREMYESENTAKLECWMHLSRSTGWWHPHEGIAFICERPAVQSVNAAGQLHCETGPAIRCRDGWEVYALNNIRMKPEYVMTPAEKLNPADVLKEENADQRRELIRKIGVERMFTVLPTRVLDTHGNYELLSVNLGNGVTDARYLKMLNPSVGCYHAEGVEPGISTVEQALNWRNSGWHKHAEILT